MCAWPPCPGLVPRLTLCLVCRVPSSLLLAHGSPTHIQGCSSPAGPSNMCFLLLHSLPRLLRLSDAARGLGFPTGTALMGWELGARNSDYKRAAAGRSQHEQPRCWLPQGRDAGTAEPPGLLLGKPGFGGGWLRGGEASRCSAVRGENQGTWMLGSGRGWHVVGMRASVAPSALDTQLWGVQRHGWHIGVSPSGGAQLWGQHLAGTLLPTPVGTGCSAAPGDVGLGMLQVPWQPSPTSWVRSLPAAAGGGCGEQPGVEMPTVALQLRLRCPSAPPTSPRGTLELSPCGMV